MRRTHAMTTPDERSRSRTRRIDKTHRLLGEGLTGLLADTYVLYNTTQLYHWNVEGPQFASLHEMFEKQYAELAEAVDLVAERIRVIGFYTPGTLSELTELSRVKQKPGVRDTERMLAHLIEAHDQTAHRIRELLGLAEESVDSATEDLLTERLRVHEKTAWMLRSQAGRASESLGAAAGLRSASIN